MINAIYLYIYIYYIIKSTITTDIALHVHFTMKNQAGIVVHVHFTMLSLVKYSTWQLGILRAMSVNCISKPRENMSDAKNNKQKQNYLYWVIHDVLGA